MWKPRFRDSSRVFHSSSTPPPGRVNARKELKSTAVAAWMVEIAVEELLVEFGSLVVALTVAVFELVVDELKVAAFTLMVMITSALTFILLSEQLTVVVAEV